MTEPRTVLAGCAIVRSMATNPRRIRRAHVFYPIPTRRSSNSSSTRLPSQHYTPTSFVLIVVARSISLLCDVTATSPDANSSKPQPNCLSSFPILRHCESAGDMARTCIMSLSCRKGHPNRDVRTVEEAIRRLRKGCKIRR